MSAIFGEILNFSQQRGPDLKLRVFGDEHYAWYETLDGYTAIYDAPLGRFCYAELNGARFRSTGVPVDQAPPPGLAKHLKESRDVRVAGAQSAMLRRLPAGGAEAEEIVRVFGPNQGLLSGRQLSIGHVRGLTILVNFQDVTSTSTVADVEEMLNGANYTRNGNICSAREYFLRVSNGKLDYSNTVVGPFKLSQPRQFYIENLLVQEAVQLAVAAGVDLRQFDSRNEGVIDALNVLYAGQSVYQGDLWPHNSELNHQFGSVRVSLYLLTGLGRDPSELSIGTFCHENGHLLCRFPDMYDYGKREGDDQDSAGIGHYCLMGAGNHLDFGRSPAPVCAYLRDLAGWCDSVVDLNVADSYRAKHGDYGVAMKYRTSKPNEYFLIENRSKMGLDRALPSSGLAIYHCDIFGSNEFQQGSADRHYQCALLQADGRKDLESNANQGDGTDLYATNGGIVLADTSNPNTREWDGRDSQLVVADVSEPGEVITFRVGANAPGQQTARGEQHPNVAILDNDPVGVASKIAIAVSGIAQRIKVEVDITHTYIGDLSVELVSPSGRRAVLHGQLGGSTHDLHGRFDSQVPGELANLVGQPMQGEWMLRVSDRAQVDVGTLDRWSLELSSAPL